MSSCEVIFLVRAETHTK